MWGGVPLSVLCLSRKTQRWLLKALKEGASSDELWVLTFQTLSPFLIFTVHLPSGCKMQKTTILYFWPGAWKDLSPLSVFTTADLRLQNNTSQTPATLSDVSWNINFSHASFCVLAWKWLTLPVVNICWVYLHNFLVKEGS